MAGLEGDADFAVGLEAADARAMSRARIDHDEGAARLVYLGARRRDDPGQCVVDRPCELAAINDQFDLVFQHVRRGIALMLAVLIAALAHDIPEQDAALCGVDPVFDRRREHSGQFGDVRRLGL